MDKKTPLGLSVQLRQKWRIGAMVLAAIIVGLIINQLMQPKRSVTAYCTVYKQEVAKLGHAGGYKYAYSTTVFPSASSNNPQDFVAAFNKLDAVAPTSIEPNVKALKEVFATINNNSGQALGASLSGLPAESAVTQWTNEHCKN